MKVTKNAIICSRRFQIITRVSKIKPNRRRFGYVWVSLAYFAKSESHFLDAAKFTLPFSADLNKSVKRQTSHQFACLAEYLSNLSFYTKILYCYRVSPAVNSEIFYTMILQQELTVIHLTNSRKRNHAVLLIINLQS